MSDSGRCVSFLTPVPSSYRRVDSMVPVVAKSRCQSMSRSALHWQCSAVLCSSRSGRRRVCPRESGRSWLSVPPGCSHVLMRHAVRVLTLAAAVRLPWPPEPRVRPPHEGSPFSRRPGAGRGGDLTRGVPAAPPSFSRLAGPYAACIRDLHKS